MNKCLISVIIPLYNKQDSILRTVKSVLLQSYSNIEIIIIDDGSTDGSLNVVKSINDKRIRIITKDNGGVSSARNLGVKKSKGKWILFLDADDFLYPMAIEKLLNTAIKYKTSISCCNFNISNSNSIQKALRYRKEGIVSNNYIYWMCHRICPRTGAALFRKDHLPEFPFDEKLSKNEDIKMIFTLFAHNKISYTPMPLMDYEQDYRGLSLDNKNREKDYVFNINFNNKSFFEKIALADLICHAYKNQMKNRRILRNKYKKNIGIFICTLFFKYVVFKPLKIKDLLI